ncbi:LLM class F420-dependent oxidoreductase [Gordonia sp. (in: high G+C Gram-positive bacteria)]|uniref:LLM class F420-dependent oxidoreductase n=1 Tax=Gordonia sp. (in: high G+C Gram-positive bacteria) TaxID=84139 RepID=UPI002C057B2B|nr:LLM class F420-dependent oxidoreductase [Gordonia sp. (in: high G+C Gram-positive bacteria)]HMS75331.1 LLM class F420-dependent oxidoreductase [Gordonia sp. (in: high G+C Gram-positive bacteria)]
MKLGMPINYAGDFRETIDHLADFERAGVGRVTVPEAYSFDAVSQLGYIAARTEKMELQTGILPMFSRTPTNLAITAAGLDYISGGRAILGIGASGPQVIEGFHGVPYNAPLGGARGHAGICRKVWRREPVTFDGKHYHLPLGPEHGGSGLGKALKIINHPVRDRIPMLLAAIGPKNTELAAELFEEFQPFLFHPGYVDAAFGEALEAGKAKRSPDLPPLRIVVNTAALITDDAEQIEHANQLVRNHCALYIGGMGARGKNFYNSLAVRYGFVDEAKLIQDLYLDGKKAEAAAAVPQDLVDSTALIGPRSQVAERVEAFRAAGVGVLLAAPAAGTHAERVEDMEILRELIG